MSEDLDLERVINDPDYRRKAIEDLNRDSEQPGDKDLESRRSKSPSAKQSQPDGS